MPNINDNSKRDFENKIPKEGYDLSSRPPGVIHFYILYNNFNHPSFSKAIIRAEPMAEQID
jgi:hypothetical protein